MINYINMRISGYWGFGAQNTKTPKPRNRLIQIFN